MARSYTPAAVFVFVSIAVWASVGHRLEWNIDEGIYLEGARRVAAGEVPYRDFFVLTGPGTFWLLGVWFRLAGVSIAAARVVVAFDWGLIAASLFVLVRQSRGMAAAAVSTTLLFAVSTLNPNLFTVNHRLDSAALAVAGITLLSIGGARRAWGAGALLAGAACATPPVALCALATGLWTCQAPQPERRAFWTGVASAAVAAVLVVAISGALPALWRQAVWTGGNYGQANRVAWGSVIGGYRDLIGDSPTAAKLLLAGVVALPAALPWLGAGSAWAVWRRATPSDRRLLSLLGLSSAAMLFSAWPRFDITHLAYAGALPWAIFGVSLPLCTPARFLRLAVLPAVAVALGLAGAFVLRPAGVPISTAAGPVLGTQQDAGLLAWLENWTAPRQPAAIYPYLPAVYFYTGAHNPTRYSFLQPGMAADADEEQFVADLERSHTPILIEVRAPAAAWLRIWPAIPPERLRLPVVEQYRDARYRAVASRFHPTGEFVIWQRRDATTEVREPSRSALCHPLSFR